MFQLLLEQMLGATELSTRDASNEVPAIAAGLEKTQKCKKKSII